MTQRILVVEDSRTQAERLRLLLTREGYQVEVAPNGREGLLNANPNFPDLVISDVTMPEMDGFEFCRAMKSSEVTERIPIILLTSRSSPADIIKGLECGADNFIPKPYEDDYLLERIRRIFEQLEHRKGGRLEMEVILTVGERKIAVTADRQQIMELLFSTFEEVSRNHDELARANQELQEARVDAERANHEKSAFLSRMSHELRTPLNAVMGFAQLLELVDLGPEDRDSVRRIGAAGRHLLDLINEVLDIGRIDAGELALSVEPVGVGDVLAEAVDLIEPLAAERSLEVSLDPGASGLHVMADRQRLKQALLNLLSNAVKYNLQGGTVTIGCAQRADGRLRIEVADTGAGIAPENLGRLFVPFDRLGADQEGTEEGTGLGLALSKRLVELMGGTMGVASEVGVGSTFWLELPVAADSLGEAGETHPGPGESARSSPGALARPAAVLYIEDNPSNLTLVERILAHRPEIKLISAMLGRLGFELAGLHRPDLILLDLNLPDVSGEEVLKQLQADPATRGIPVVVVSADASDGLRRKLLAAGARDYITKPFDVPGLIHTLDEILSARLIV
jgi:signal transduction histidine kinase